MKAAVLTEYNQIAWKDVEKPVCKAGEVLIQITYASICGSDQHIFRGGGTVCVLDLRPSCI